MSEVTVKFLRGFDEPGFGRRLWASLLRRRVPVFLTWEWQQAWWESFGRGRLMLAAAARDGEVVALAPLFAESGMVFFVGSGGSDYLDFVGDVSDPMVLAEILDAVRSETPEFLGFRFYHVPEQSSTGACLQQAAGRLEMVCFDEGELPAPALEFDDPQRVRDAACKKSLLRHESWFRHNGALEVEHLQDGRSILPHLEEFFEQHISRWRNTLSPSLFHDQSQRNFYRRLTERAADSGWLRFTRLQWEGRSIAFHFGFSYQGSYLWYKPCFAIDLARHSPGEVLLRQLLLKAAEEGVDVFDFGLGDEFFKSRFATCVNLVRTWGLYPKGGRA